MVIYLRPATRVRIVAVLSVILVVLGVRAGISVQPGPVEVSAKILPITHVGTSLPEVGLVVDVTSGGPEQVNACLAALDSLGAKATWFVTATFAEAEEAVVKEIEAKGHELGVKGTGEKRIDNLPEVEIRDRLQRARQALLKAGIEAAPFLYPPGQRYSDKLVSLAFENGYQAVKPGIDLTRMKGKEDGASQKIAGDLAAGDILLMRVEKKGVVPAEKYLAALSGVIKEKNLTVVTLSGLFRGVQ